MIHNDSRVGAGNNRMSDITWCGVAYIVLVSLLCWGGARTEEDGEPFPKEFDFRYTSYQDLMKETWVFEDSSIVGYTQLTLDINNDQLLVGAQNSLFRLALNDLYVLEKAVVKTQPEKEEFCINIGQKKVNCQNHIRVLLLQNYTQTDRFADVEQVVFVCGTNGYSPLCSWRPATNLSYVINDVSGKGKSPYNPSHNSTAIITADGDFYGATAVGPGDRDPAILRSKFTLNSGELRTVQSNSKWLNDPDFISAYEIGEYVYFFFREVAVEYINCGKRIYSRVARVCKTDTGGVFTENAWTTYFKARLNCSLPGEYPFYYDEIQSTFLLDQGTEKFVYAVFNTPMNSIAGSAVCVFNLTAFNETFTGPFKHQDSPRSAWERHDNPHPLTKCPEKKAPSKRSHGNKMIESKYQLMDNAVQPTSILPLVHTQNERYTHIVVDSVKAKNGIFNVVFVATADGKIRKMTKLPGFNETCLLEEIKIVPNGEHKPVKAMRIAPNKMALYIATQMSIVKIPVQRCSQFKSEELCLNANDPYCGWDSANSKCTTAPSGQPEVWYWAQSMTGCPVVPHPVDGGWSDWTPWEKCSQVGGDPTSGDCLCRSRLCNNPRPYEGGKACVGSSVEVTNCTAHGQWTDWSSWTSCSKSCGFDAVRVRYRYCSNPPPRFGGLECLGPSYEDEYCQGHPPCPLPPIQGNWTEWADWSECSVKCNGGIQTRRRSCPESSSAGNVQPCVGNHQEWRLCNTQVCAELFKMTPWTPWVAVNHTNGGYFEERFRFVCRAPVSSQTLIKTKPIKTQSRFCFEGGQCHDSGELTELDTHSPIDRVLRRYCKHRRRIFRNYCKCRTLGIFLVCQKCGYG